MGDVRQGTDGTLLSRYECKYIVSEETAHRLRAYIQPFMRPDPFAARHPDLRYQICSLYLDSPDLQLYRTTVEGHKNRFKLRIRTYSDDPRTPAFFEIKRRAEHVVLKRRARVHRAAIPELLGNRTSSHNLHEDPDAAEFLSTSLFTRARPTMRIRYKREAYESRSEDPVRITFDTELQHAITPDFELNHNGPGWQPTPVPGVILEVKFTEVFPSWVQLMIEQFELDKRSVAKYVLSVDEAIARGTYTPIVPLARGLGTWELGREWEG